MTTRSLLVEDSAGYGPWAACSHRCGQLLIMLRRLLIAAHPGNKPWGINPGMSVLK